MQPQTQKKGAGVRRLMIRLAAIEKQLARLDQQMNDVRALLTDRTYRLARRVARLEAESPAVQCRLGS